MGGTKGYEDGGPKELGSFRHSSLNRKCITSDSDTLVLMLRGKYFTIVLLFRLLFPLFEHYVD